LQSTTTRSWTTASCRAETTASRSASGPRCRPTTCAASASLSASTRRATARTRISSTPPAALFSFSPLFPSLGRRAAKEGRTVVSRRGGSDEVDSHLIMPSILSRLSPGVGNKRREYIDDEDERRGVHSARDRERDRDRDRDRDLLHHPHRDNRDHRWDPHDVYDGERVEVVNVYNTAVPSAGVRAPAGARILTLPLQHQVAPLSPRTTELVDLRMRVKEQSMVRLPWLCRH